MRQHLVHKANKPSPNELPGKSKSRRRMSSSGPGPTRQATIPAQPRQLLNSNYSGIPSRELDSNETNTRTSNNPRLYTCGSTQIRFVSPLLPHASALTLKLAESSLTQPTKTPFRPIFLLVLPASPKIFHSTDSLINLAYSLAPPGWPQAGLLVSTS